MAQPMIRISASTAWQYPKVIDALAKMDGKPHSVYESADAIASGIMQVTRSGNRRVVVRTDDGDVTEDDIASMTWEVTPGVTAFAVAVSSTYPDGSPRPHGLQFTIPYHVLRSGHATYSVDWGDGTKSENISDEHPVHAYSSAGVYKIEVSDDISTMQCSMHGTTSGKYNSNNPNFPVGTWSQVVTDGHTAGYWDVDNRLKVVRALQYGSNYVSSYFSYDRCYSLTGAIPAWGAAITNANSTYYGCSGLTGAIPAWGVAITNAQSTYQNCSGLTGAVPAWGAAITNAYATYYDCSGLTGAIPAWGAAITNAYRCFYYATGLTGVWDESATDAELMPSKITSHADCFTGCDDRLRASFLTGWGGSRAS